MPATALLMALSLMAADTPSPAAAKDAEPLPPGAPTADYPLAAWCYGALSEYLDIYERVKPDLVAIDKMFGSSVQNEAEPYADDMAAARKELTVIGGAVEAAEKASPRPIAPQGVAAIKQGQAIWRPAEEKTRRELARAWLSWGLPDRCDSTARSLGARSALLGKALNYNDSSGAEPAPAAPAPAEPAPSDAAAPETPPPVAADPNTPIPDAPTPPPN